MRRRRKKKPSAVIAKLDKIKVAIQQLSGILANHSGRISTLEFVRPPEESIRVVTQKVNPDPQTPFEQGLAWTTKQVNQHLNGLGETDMQDIIQSALTGK